MGGLDREAGDAPKCINVVCDIDAKVAALVLHGSKCDSRVLILSRVGRETAEDAARPNSNSDGRGR